MDKFAQNELLILFSKIAIGDEKAFTIVFRRYYDIIFSTAIQYCKTRQLAEDVTQQVFFALWENRSSLNNIKNAEGWLWTLARNQAITVLKKESIRAQYITYVKELFQSESETPLQQLILREKYDLINSIIKSLPMRQQQVYRMNRYEGITYAKIAQILKISTETVKEHMAKALKTIRAALLAHKNDLLPLVAFYFIIFF